MTGRIDDNVGQGDVSQKSGVGVGGLLRASRVRCGEDLPQVAGALRIRLAYLEAIENGRFGELPGPAYTLGFVRTYANHLGLDVEEVIRRLRAETEIEAVKPDLSFPVPVSDTTMPTGAVIMIGVVAAVVAYGAYLAGSSGDRVEVARVSPIPERMATNTGAANAQSTNGLAATGSAAGAPAVDARAETPPVPAAPSSESKAASTGESAMIETSAAAPAPAPTPAVQAPTPAPAPVASAPTPPSTPDAAPQVAALPQPPRIEVRAKADSWIQVREGAAGAMLFTRLLRVGETYVVPDRSGLMLLTGNAGALEILVDGAAVPALGPAGAVRRSIALDADRLKTGIAAVE